MNSYLKFGMLALGVALMSASSMAQAQNLSGRTAAVGAIIGAIAGSQNDEAIGGAAIGGLVGGVAGRAIQRSRYGNIGGFGGSGFVNPGFSQPVFTQPTFQQPAFANPGYYNSGYHYQQPVQSPIYIQPNQFGGSGGGFLDGVNVPRRVINRVDAFCPLRF